MGRCFSAKANRWYETGDPERIWEKVDKTDSCWLWTGASSDPRGYGRFRYKGRNAMAHRVAYELVVGPIPAGLQLDHLCRNPRCVRPDHLEPVTCGENLLRGETFNARNAAKTRCLRGHELSGDNLYRSAGRRHCRACWRVRRAA